MFFPPWVNLSTPFVFADIDDCVQAVCMNGATCLDGVTSYTCQCARGYQGRFCEQSKNMWFMCMNMCTCMYMYNVQTSMSCLSVDCRSIHADRCVRIYFCHLSSISWVRCDFDAMLQYYWCYNTLAGADGYQQAWWRQIPVSARLVASDGFSSTLAGSGWLEQNAWWQRMTTLCYRCFRV